MALKFCTPQLKAMDKPDLERILPIVLFNYMPAGVVGFLLAGLLAAFMSNFAATVNAAPAYIVNDIYKRYINPNAPARTEIRMSRISSLAVLAVGLALGLLTKNILSIMWWIVGALNGAYVIANVLKWLWWRFNGYGYFWGMMTGILSAMFVPELMKHIPRPRHQRVVHLPRHLRHFGCGLPRGHLPDQGRRRCHPQEVLQDRQSLGLLGTNP